MLYKGIFIREDNTMDKYIVDEMESDYAPILELVRGKVVMDVGANIGAFSTRALLNGASKVIAIEPEPINLEYLYDNLAGLQAIVIEGVVGMEDGTATLMVNDGTNNGLHSINPEALVVKKDNYHTLEVKQYSLGALLNKYKPEVLKIDIEGGELLMVDLLTDLPDHIEHIAIEFDTIEDKYIPILQYLALNFKDAERNKFFTGSRR